MIDKELLYSSEWVVLHELAKRKGLSNLERIQTDASLNKKVNWFLFNGVTGVLMLIKEIYGSTDLKEFYMFLDYFMKDVDKPGHYQYSDKIKSDIKTVKSAVQESDFKKYLEQLKQELIKLDSGKWGRK